MGSDNKRSWARGDISDAVQSVIDGVTHGSAAPADNDVHTAIRSALRRSGCVGVRSVVERAVYRGLVKVRGHAM